MKSFKLEKNVSPKQYFITGIISIIPSIIFYSGVLGSLFMAIAIASFGMSLWIYGKNKGNLIIQIIGFLLLGLFTLILGIFVISFFQGFLS